MNAHINLIKTPQTGSALIISLLILLVMTLIGVTAMSSSNLEEKMAGNSRDSMLAFEAAEAGLRDGEDAVSRLVNIASFTSCSATYQYAIDCNPDVMADATWATAQPYSGTLDKIKTAPKYMIEYTGISGATQSLNVDNYGDNSSTVTSMFRVTARGTGGSDNTAVILQSYNGKII